MYVKFGGCYIQGFFLYTHITILDQQCLYKVNSWRARWVVFLFWCFLFLVQNLFAFFLPHIYLPTIGKLYIHTYIYKVYTFHCCCYHMIILKENWWSASERAGAARESQRRWRIVRWCAIWRIHFFFWRVFCDCKKRSLVCVCAWCTVCG